MPSLHVVWTGGIASDCVTLWIVAISTLDVSQGLRAYCCEVSLPTSNELAHLLGRILWLDICVLVLLQHDQCDLCNLHMLMLCFCFWVCFPNSMKLPKGPASPIGFFILGLWMLVTSWEVAF